MDDLNIITTDEIARRWETTMDTARRCVDAAAERVGATVQRVRGMRLVTPALYSLAEAEYYRRSARYPGGVIRRGRPRKGR